MRFKNLFSMVFWALALLSGCASQYDDRMASIHDKNKLMERQAVLMKPSFDLSKVTVARFSVDGERHEVNSLMPLKLAEFKSEQGDSVTILAFNKPQDRLVLFTFDALSGKGYEIDLLLSDFEAKKKILFPVVNAKDGKVVDTVFELNDMIRR